MTDIAHNHTVTHQHHKMEQEGELIHAALTFMYLYNAGEKGPTVCVILIASNSVFDENILL